MEKGFLMGAKMTDTYIRDEEDMEETSPKMRDEIALKLEILLRDFLNSADNLLNGFSHKDSVTWH